MLCRRPVEGILIDSVSFGKYRYAVCHSSHQECAVRLTVLLLAAILVSPVYGQEKPQETKPTGPKPSRVEVTPRVVETVAGQQLSFSAAGYDEAGNKMDAQPSAWFAAPFDLAFADEKGTVTFTGSGDVRVGAACRAPARAPRPPTRGPCQSAVGRPERPSPTLRPWGEFSRLPRAAVESRELRRARPRGAPLPRRRRSRP